MNGGRKNENVISVGIVFHLLILMQQQLNLCMQRWMKRSLSMLCMSRVYNRSLLNQRERERYRTLPNDLSQLGAGASLGLRHYWFDVAGSDNAIDEDKHGYSITRLIFIHKSSL
jgi:hypothetical protein